MSDQDVVGLILSEHDVFRRDFDALQGLHGDALREAWERLAAALEVHAAGEEAVFYPHVVRQLPEGEGETEHALHDHNEIRAAARAVAEQELATEGWWAAVRTAQEVNGDHMAEEERDILGDVQERLPQPQRDELGLAWLAFHEEHDGARGLSGEPEDVDRYVEAAREERLPQEQAAAQALEEMR